MGMGNCWRSGHDRRSALHPERATSGLLQIIHHMIIACRAGHKACVYGSRHHAQTHNNCR